MDKDMLRKKVENPKGERWLVWGGYITNETDEKRDIEYFGRFASTKNSALGAVKLLMDHTDVYRIIIQDTKAFKVDSSLFQSELSEFFKIEEGV